ncbi:response regulator transcription factor [Anoxybacillus ayderensis]|uniref:response regulator transcription factor n=1 Tax=Anoxybacillus ayderensis TaxID=265546 RepID=UPI000A26C492|nr:response regulator transcription factor [Anoxybacillus ayderensis]MED0657420.1 response regulator transcription factor [Anoxybacillus ayderensis]MED0686326.1 response regulator transcription factor [Anoxybacillus ayderensis]OSX55615.1 helix-turn-helix transcriptional regulator [Anoxybacillus ayderensis]
MAVRTLLVDSDPIYLLGLEKLLEKERGVHIVGSVSCIDSLEDLIHIHVPDVIVINMHMHIIKVLEWIKSAKKTYPTINVIMLCNYPPFALCAYEAGVSVTLSKEKVSTHLPHAIRHSNEGERLLLLDSEATCHMTHCLTKIEIDILQMLADDQTSVQISQRLNISKRTVERHLSSIFEKLGVLSRTGAVAQALRWQLIK